MKALLFNGIKKKTQTLESLFDSLLYISLWIGHFADAHIQSDLQRGQIH